MKTQLLRKNIFILIILFNLLSYQIFSQVDEILTCGFNNKHFETEEFSKNYNNEFYWTDCDTIRTYLISILPEPREDNWISFNEALQNVADQTDIHFIDNLGTAHMVWSEMIDWMQGEVLPENAWAEFQAYQYDSMPIALSDTIRNIIDRCGPDVLFLEFPGNWTSHIAGVARGGKGRGMIGIRSLSAHSYKVVLGHELGHECGLKHNDTINNIMNSSASGNTSLNFTSQHIDQINEQFRPFLIFTNEDRQCELTNLVYSPSKELITKIFPNPAATGIPIKVLTQQAIRAVSIFNSTGTLLESRNQFANKVFSIEINTAGYIPGLYILKVIGETSTQAFQIIIV